MQTVEVTPVELPPDEIPNSPNIKSPNEFQQPVQVLNTGTKSVGIPVMKKKRGGARPNTGGARPGAGRPRKPYMPPATPINTREMPSHALKLPAPPKQWITKPEEFFTYWKSITDPELSGRVTVHVYRNWPVCDLRKFDIPGEKKSVTSIDKIEGRCIFEPDNWQQDVLRQWGSGDYKMLFNEGSVNRATCININVRDMVNFPPILDYKYVSESDPLNKDFVRWARSSGRLQTEGEQRDEEDMAANAESTLALTDTIKDLTSELISRNSQPPQAPPPAPISENSRAAVASIDMVKETMSAMVGMIKSQQPASSPIEDAGKLIEMARTLVNPTPAATDNGTQRLMEKMLADADRRADESRIRAEKLEERLNAFMLAQHAPTQAAPAKTLIEQLTELKTLRESFGDLMGGGGDEGTSSTRGGKSSTLSTILDLLPTILDAGVKITSNAAQMMRSTQQQPQRPQSTQPQQFQQPPQPASPYAGLPPGMQPRPEQPQPQPIAVMPTPQSEPANVTGTVEVDPQQQVYAAYHPFLAQIEPALTHHLQEKLGGDVFAEWLVNSRPDGKMLYAQIVDAGVESLTGLLLSYPPIRDVAALVPKRFAAFIDEFMAYGNDEDEGEDGEQKGNPAA